MENINQSLAGRTAILKLLPFSHAEMKESGILPQTVDDEIFNGGYPRLYDKDIAPSDYYPFYIQTYVEAGCASDEEHRRSQQIHSLY